MRIFCKAFTELRLIYFIIGYIVYEHRGNFTVLVTIHEIIQIISM